VATETPHAGPTEQVGFDLDEDLFNFDEVASPEEAADSSEELIAALESESISRHARVEDSAPAAATVAARSPEPSDLARAPSATGVPVATVSAGAAAAGDRGASPWLSRVSLVLLASVTALNALVAVVVMRNTSEVREGLEEVGSSMESTVRRLEDQVLEAARAEVSAVEPLPTSDAARHPALELAVEEITAGDFARARQRIYSLLAIVDRLAPADRDAIESRASFLLARSYHLEALSHAAAEPGPATPRDAAPVSQAAAHAASGAEEHR
jgi:hypothetical protein